MNAISGPKAIPGIAILVSTLLLAACLPTKAPPQISTRTQPSPPTTTPTWTPRPTERNRWPELLQHTPVPWTTPLPPFEPTILDGTYIKDDPSEPQWWVCTRCADYALAGGIWRLKLERGIFRIYYTETAWRSLGSYTVEGDHLILFNDPYCQWDVGEYIWHLDDGQLRLAEVKDPCSTSFRLRAANLTKQEWLACQSPTGDAAPPPGCTSD